MRSTVFSACPCRCYCDMIRSLSIQMKPPAHAFYRSQWGCHQKRDMIDTTGGLYCIQHSALPSCLSSQIVLHCPAVNCMCPSLLPSHYLAERMAPMLTLYTALLSPSGTRSWISQMRAPSWSSTSSLARLPGTFCSPFSLMTCNCETKLNIDECVA